MSNEKKQENFTKIPNHIIEKLVVEKLNGTQFRILLVLLRYTKGFHREWHDFSLTFVAEALSIDKSYVRKELNTLIEQNVILVVEEAGFNKPRKLQINSDVNAWMVKKSPQWRNTTTVEQKEYSTVEEKRHTTEVENSPSTVDKLLHQEIKKKEINKENNKDDEFLY